MREIILRMFFTGSATAEELEHDMEGTVRVRGPQTREVHVDPMTVDFDLRASHLVQLCDAVIAGAFDPRHLEAIGFALIGSDRFNWDAETADGARVAEVVNDWAAPEINYALTPATAAKFRHYLLTGERTFDRSDHSR